MSGVKYLKRCPFKIVQICAKVNLVGGACLSPQMMKTAFSFKKQWSLA